MLRTLRNMGLAALAGGAVATAAGQLLRRREQTASLESLSPPPASDAFIPPARVTPLPTPPEAVPDLQPGQEEPVLGDGLPPADPIQCRPPNLIEQAADVSDPLLGSTNELRRGDSTRLWFFLQQETYRHRGEGFRSDWAFHQYAASNKLGAPLAPSARAADFVNSGGRQYGFQPFAFDTLYNQIPFWSQVSSMNLLLDGTIPAAGLGRDLLFATYRASGSNFRPQWLSHQVAVQRNWGPAVSVSYRITVEGRTYGVQVFALETMFFEEPNANDMRLLSASPPGAVTEAMWRETYKVAGALYQPDAPFCRFAKEHKLGVPISDIYLANFDGETYALQVFAADTIYARPGEEIQRLSLLPPPSSFEPPPITPPDQPGPEDALSTRTPVFTVLPISGQPRISQFYGYTRWAAGDGRFYYLATQGQHSGIDFAVPMGTPLLALTFGVVVWAGWNVDGVSFGAGPRSIIVRYGAVYALYGHTSAEVVQRGQFVGPGDLLGYSGFPNAPHLHFEIRPVPAGTLTNTDPAQLPANPGYAINAIDYFAPDLSAYFERELNRLGGAYWHFCQGALRNQANIVFGGPIDNRPCQ